MGPDVSGDTPLRPQGDGTYRRSARSILLCGIYSDNFAASRSIGWREAQRKERIPVYGTGPNPLFHKERGFFGAKVPFPYGPADGRRGFEANVRAIAAHRGAVGDGYPLMVDCYMSLDVAYAVEFARAVEPYGLYWIEEALHPDDWEGYRQLKAAAPWVRWVTGEHEYTRWGFRELIRHRAIDIVQPDLMWAGGFSEALRIASLASAFDVTVVPHAGGITATTMP